MWAPLHLSHSIFVPEKLGLANTTNTYFPKLDHPAIPDLDGFIDPRAGYDERLIFIPIQSEDLSSRCWDSKRRGVNRICEIVDAGSSRRVCWCSEIKYLDCTVSGTRRKNIMLVGREEGLVYTRMMGL